MNSLLELINAINSECSKVTNFLLVDSNTLTFTSKKFVHFLNISTKKLTSRRCTHGNQISTLAKSQSNDLLAIAENGEKSMIFIHEFPSMELQSEISIECNQSLDHLSFNCSDKKLAAQSNEPKFEITIWDWKMKIIYMRYTSQELNTVFDLKFSKRAEDLMFICGLQSIYFWDLSNNFIERTVFHREGRFDSFEQCNLWCIYPDPDNNDRILSNNNSGNVLIWERECVKCEICRKGRKPLHNGTIIQIHLYDENLYTIGADNFVRIWFWDAVALDRMEKTQKIIEFEMTYDVEIPISYSADRNLLSFCIDDESEICYVHDGNGAIWKITFQNEYTAHRMETIFHSSPEDIVDLVVSPVFNFLVTIGAKGIFHVFNYLNGQVLFHYRFAVPSSTVVWLTQEFDPNGKTVIFGFIDGTIRSYCLNIMDTVSIDESHFKLLQLLKPHTDRITNISVSSDGPIMVSGSEDRTIFIYRIVLRGCVPKLSPLGFVPLNTIVQNLKVCAKEIDKKRKTCSIMFSDGNTTKQLTIPENMETTENSLLLKNFQIEEIDVDPNILCSRPISISNDIPLDLNTFNVTLTSDAKYLIAYNQMGSILLYKWKTESNESQIAFHNKACNIKHPYIEDTFDSELLSLEQQKHLEMENNRKVEIESKRLKTLKMFDHLKMEFKKIKQRNNNLPNEYRLPEMAFEIDRRISEDFQQKTNTKLDSMRMEWKWKIDSLRRCHERIRNAYLLNVEHWPTTLCGFRNSTIVETFTIFKTSDFHQTIQIVFERRKMAANLENSSESSESIKWNETCASHRTISQPCDDQMCVMNAFIASIADRIDSKDIDIQTKRLYKKYVARKKQDYERKEQWKRIEMNEPIRLFPKNNDEHIRSKFEDIVTETQAETNKLITCKYNALMSMKNQMIQMKRQFNQTVQAMQQDKQKKCQLLSIKIEKFCQNYETLHTNGQLNIKMAIEEYAEIFETFDGTSFQEIILTVPIFEPMKYICNETCAHNLMAIESIRMLLEQKSLSDEIENIYQNFDSEFKTINETRYKIASDLKFMELYYLTVYQEFMLLNQFEQPQKLLLNAIADLTIRERQIQREIDTKKISLKMWIDANNEYWTNEAAIEMNAFFKQNGKFECLMVKKFQKVLSNLKESFENGAFSVDKSLLVDELKTHLDELTSTIRDIQANEYELNKLLQERENALNNIDVVVLVSEEDKKKIISTCENDNNNNLVLVTKDNVPRTNDQLTEYEIQTKNELAKQKSFQLELNRMKTICRKMNEKIISLRSEIHDKMIKKFGMKIDFDEMEEAVLTRMIAEQTKTAENDHQTQVELGKLKRKMEAKNQELLIIKQNQVEKYNVLIVLQEQLNSIHAEQKHQKQLRKKYSKMDDKYNFGDTSDLDRLQEISKRQKQRIKQITREIQTLRSKVKSQDQFKLHECVEQKRNSPQMLKNFDLFENNDAHLIRSRSLDSFPFNATN